MAKPKTKERSTVTPDDYVEVTNTAHDGYRRAGMKHAKGAVVHAPGTFDARQLAALDADPRIFIAKAEPPAKED